MTPKLPVKETTTVPGLVRLNERVEIKPVIPTELRAPDPEIEDEFNPLLHDGGAAIELGMQQLQIELEVAANDYTGNSCRLALGAHYYLTETIGIDFREVCRRWSEAPTLLIPTHVANRYGASDRGSLLHLLDDAVRAYVLGAPAAAFAMCRAAFEMVLKHHYAEGELQDPKAKLAKVVAFASERGFIKREEIRPLVERADGILHRYAQEAMLSDEDERTILIFLATLKSLIERASIP